jgi:hypothetical protein
MVETALAASGAATIGSGDGDGISGTDFLLYVFMSEASFRDPEVADRREPVDTAEVENVPGTRGRDADGRTH